MEAFDIETLKLLGEVLGGLALLFGAPYLRICLKTLNVVISGVELAAQRDPDFGKLLKTLIQNSADQERVEHFLNKRVQKVTEK